MTSEGSRMKGQDRDRPVNGAGTPSPSGESALPGAASQADRNTKDAAEPAPEQRKVVRVLVCGQILGGIGMGATLSLGALLAAGLSGSSAWSGMAATMSTLGAAVVAVPLARLAQARGRRVSLTTGSLIAGTGAVLAITAACLGLFGLLLPGLMLLGAGSATNLQARFAATDLATATTRGRDLSIVVWSTTVGAVLGPNLFEPGEVVGSALGLPPLTGAFVFSLLAQAGAALTYALGLRPDPLLTALSRHDAGIPGAAPGTHPTGAGPHSRRSGVVILRTNARARYAVAAVGLSNAAMVALMAMTPVHLRDHGATLSIVGLTISLHVAGMYALSPLFGWLADRFGRVPVILAGQGLLLAALVCAWLGAESQGIVTVGLILLGLGWSASVVSGSALVADAVPAEQRAALQGVSDLTMNAAGALGGALAGPMLYAAGFSGLGLAIMVPVGAVAVWSAARLVTGRRAAALPAELPADRSQPTTHRLPRR